MYTEDYVHLEKDDLVKVACQQRLEARGGLYDAEGHAFSRLQLPTAPTQVAWAHVTVSPFCLACPQLEQERKKCNSYAESLKIAKEQSLAAVSAARRLPRAMLLRL